MQDHLHDRIALDLEHIDFERSVHDRTIQEIDQQVRFIQQKRDQEARQVNYQIGEIRSRPLLERRQALLEKERRQIALGAADKRLAHEQHLLELVQRSQALSAVSRHTTYHTHSPHQRPQSDHASPATRERRIVSKVEAAQLRHRIDWHREAVGVVGLGPTHSERSGPVAVGAP